MSSITSESDLPPSWNNYASVTQSPWWALALPMKIFRAPPADLSLNTSRWNVSMNRFRMSSYPRALALMALKPPAIRSVLKAVSVRRASMLLILDSKRCIWARVSSRSWSKPTPLGFPKTTSSPKASIRAVASSEDSFSWANSGMSAGRDAWTES